MAISAWLYLQFSLFLFILMYISVYGTIPPSTLDLVLACCTTKWGLYFACTYLMYYALPLPEESFAGRSLDLPRFDLILLFLIEHLVPVCCLTCTYVQLALSLCSLVLTTVRCSTAISWFKSKVSKRTASFQHSTPIIATDSNPSLLSRLEPTWPTSTTSLIRATGFGVRHHSPITGYQP